MVQLHKGSLEIGRKSATVYEINRITKRLHLGKTKEKDYFKMCFIKYFDVLNPLEEIAEVWKTVVISNRKREKRQLCHIWEIRT